MKNIVIAIAVLLIATAAGAQQMNIQTTRGGAASSNGVFSIGPRVSNYSTDLDAGFAPLKTGRQSSFGVFGDYRNGQFVLDFSWDHDPQNGIGITDLILDVGEYERDHGEVTVGYAIAPFLDLQGGARIDQIRVGGASFFGENFLTDLDIDHQAIGAGLKLHTADGAPVGFYVLGRGYFGSAKFDVTGTDVNTDTTGYRGEAGLNIRLGQSQWFVVPAFEYDHLETKDYDIRLNTNRFILGFAYKSGL